MGQSTCTEPDCPDLGSHKGLCPKHYTRLRRTGTLEGPKRAEGCEIPGCTRPHAARGWCGTHYQRWRNYGDPLATMVPAVDQTLRERVESKVDKQSDDGCWLWTGTMGAYGYGLIKFEGRMKQAHRASYEAFVGPIPEDLQIDHLCRVRNCVNPKHLEAVTPQVNVLRSENRSAHNARRTECIYGHPLSGDNLYEENGHRRCRACNKRRNDEHRARKKAAARNRTQET